LNPKYVSVESVPEKEKKEYEDLVRAEISLEKKPAEIIEKIVSGKVGKHFEEISLLSQAFVKNPDITVEDLIKEKIAKIGENIRIGNFVRFEI
jgi:elongation factor Ts